MATQLEKALQDIQKTYLSLAQTRQAIVVRTLVYRDSGLEPPRDNVADFAAARENMLTAARSIDQALDMLREQDAAAWQRIEERFAEESAKLPGGRISSTSIEEVLAVGLDPISEVLFSTSSSSAAQAAADIEQANYPKTGSGGVGFIQAWAGAVTGSACITAAAGAGLATAGVGAVVVGIGCLLLALAAVAATIYVGKLLFEFLRDVCLPSVAKSDAEARRLAALAGSTLALNKTLELLPPDKRAEFARQYTEQGIKPPPEPGLPWSLILLGAGAVALWLYWPTLAGKARAFRSSQGVSGLRKPRRRLPR
jgi:hypothetical protein